MSNFRKMALDRSGGGGNFHRLGYGMCHFLRVLFWFLDQIVMKH